MGPDFIIKVTGNEAAQKLTGEYELLYPSDGPLNRRIKEWNKLWQR